MRNYTDITILLDRSGSMQSIKHSMETAFNKFIKEHRKNPSTRISLTQFEGNNPADVVYTAVPVSEVDGLNLIPGGATPLFDAICLAIDSKGRRLSRMPEKQRPDQVLFVIITDGQENASKEFSRADVKKRISKQADDYGWAFIYLGANQDAIAEAKSFGIPMQWTINYAATAVGSANSMDSLVGNTVSYASNDSGMRGLTKSLTFTAEQRKKAMAKDDSQAK